MSENTPEPETSQGELEQKEAHRVGTINRWDAPDASWAAEYDWTRYRGPPAYPVPGGWVLGIVEGDGTGWRYYGEDGIGESNDPESPAEPTAEAGLLFDVANPDETSLRDEPDMEWRFTLDGEVVFRRVEPDRDDAYGAIAKALSAFHEGTPPSEISETPSSGRKPADVREQEEVERKQQENQSLDRWSK